MVLVKCCKCHVFDEGTAPPITGSPTYFACARSAFEGAMNATLTIRILSNSHKMPIQDHFHVPLSVQELPIANELASKLFVCFISSTDPSTKQPWCPDVRAALPQLEKAFSSQDAPKLAYVHVGQKAECVFFSLTASFARAHLSITYWH
jgi:hypothetical protein